MNKSNLQGLVIAGCLGAAIALLFFGILTGLIPRTTEIEVNRARLERLRAENQALKAEKAAAERAEAVATETLLNRVNTILDEKLIEEDKRQ